MLDARCCQKEYHPTFGKPASPKSSNPYPQITQIQYKEPFVMYEEAEDVNSKFKI